MTQCSPGGTIQFKFQQNITYELEVFSGRLKARYALDGTHTVYLGARKRYMHDEPGITLRAQHFLISSQPPISQRQRLENCADCTGLKI